MTLGSLVLGTNANLVLTLGAAGSGTNSSLQVNGNLVLDGLLSVYDNGGMNTGTVYQVIHYTGALTNRGLSINSGTRWDVTVNTSVTNYVSVTAVRKYPFIEMTNGNLRSQAPTPTWAVGCRLGGACRCGMKCATTRTGSGTTARCWPILPGALLCAICAAEPIR